MQPAALQRVSEMKKFYELMLQIEIAVNLNLQLRLDDDHDWIKKNVLQQACKETLAASSFAESAVMVWQIGIGPLNNDDEMMTERK